MTEPVVLLRDVEKAYGGLRPLRVKALDVAPNEVVSLSGMESGAAAVLTDLITGTVLPDRGEVRVADRSTASIAGQDDWLAFLEQFGIVNDRVVLLDAMTVAQNLAVPLTLDLDPIPAPERAVVQDLSEELGIASPDLDGPLANQPAALRVLVRLGRALVHQPRLLIMEHPTVGVDDRDVGAIADRLKEAVARRRLSALVVSSDARFTERLGGRRLAWRPGDGSVANAASGWRRLLGG